MCSSSKLEVDSSLNILQANANYSIEIKGSRIKLWIKREGHTWQDNDLDLKCSIKKTGVVTYGSNHSTLDVETGESVEGQHWLHSKLRASLGTMKLKTKQKYQHDSFG